MGASPGAFYPRRDGAPAPLTPPSSVGGPPQQRPLDFQLNIKHCLTRGVDPASPACDPSNALRSFPRVILRDAPGPPAYRAGRTGCWRAVARDNEAPTTSALPMRMRPSPGMATALAILVTLPT